MNPLTSPLLTNLYQLNMIQAYLDHGERLPQPLAGTHAKDSLSVTVADALVRLAAEVDERIAKSQTAS